MGNVKLIALLFIVCIVFSCNNEHKTKKNLNLSPGDFTWHKVDYLNLEMPLPDVYKEMNYVEFGNKFYELYPDSVSTSEFNLMVAHLEHKQHYSIFVDTVDIINHIIVEELEYTDFDKRGAGFYKSIFEKNLSKNCEELGIPCLALSNKYITAGESKIIKFRYEINDRFLTQYIITTKGRTFAFTSKISDPLAFDTEIKAMRIK